MTKQRGRQGRSEEKSPERGEKPYSLGHIEGQEVEVLAEGDGNECFRRCERQFMADRTISHYFKNNKIQTRSLTKAQREAVARETAMASTLEAAQSHIEK